MIQHFISSQFGFGISEILQTLQYVARFFGLEPSKEYPIKIRQNKDIVSFITFKLHRKLKKSSFHIKHILKEEWNL